MSRMENSQENGVENKQQQQGPTETQFECRLLIPSKMAGSIIGKKGANIQMLRSEFAANVKLPDSPGPERIFSLTAEDYDTACEVIEKALPFMFNDTSEKENELRLLVHTGAVGAVIGKGGHKIKQIRELSGANVKAYQNCAPQSSERVISIRGERDCLVPALRLCFQVIVENGQRGPGMPYDPANFDAYFAHEYGGYGGSGAQAGVGGRFGPEAGGGCGGAGVRGGGMRMRGGGGQGRGGGGGGGGSMPPPGPPLGYPSPAGFVAAGAGGFPARPPMGRGFGMDAFGRDVGGGGGFAPPPPVRAKFAGGPDARFAGGAPGPAGGPPGAPDMSWATVKPEEEEEGPRDITQVTIPKDLAGAIIGPGGQRIRKIRNYSKASIVIEEPQAGSTERLITIEGTEGQISVAKNLLKQAVSENRAMQQAGYGPVRY